MDYKNIPLYAYTAEKAFERGELIRYRESLKASIACRDAIDAEVSASFDGYSLDSETAAEKVVGQFGYERTLYVLANTVQHNKHDGRFSARNREWAKTITVVEDASRDLTCSSHPGVLDMFITQVVGQYKEAVLHDDSGKTKAFPLRPKTSL